MTSSVTCGKLAAIAPSVPTGTIVWITFGGGPWAFAITYETVAIDMYLGTALTTASVTAKFNALAL